MISRKSMLYRINSQYETLFYAITVWAKFCPALSKRKKTHSKSQIQTIA